MRSFQLAPGQTYKVYVLELENGMYYVGVSHNVERRYIDHQKHNTSWWTGLHKPVKIVEVRDTGTPVWREAMHIENAVTVEYAQNKGWDKVRGGVYSNHHLDWPTGNETLWRKALRRERIIINESQAKFAERWGAKPQHVFQWESGEHTMPGAVTLWLVERLKRYSVSEETKSKEREAV